jgi:hypothetical protein
MELRARARLWQLSRAQHRLRVHRFFQISAIYSVSGRRAVESVVGRDDGRVRGGGLRGLLAMCRQHRRTSAGEQLMLPLQLCSCFKMQDGAWTQELWVE